MFAIGAVLGRLIGALVAELLPDWTGLATEGEFAMVCAAAFSGAVTRTIAPAVLVMELTAQVNANCTLHPACFTQQTALNQPIEQQTYLPALRLTSSQNLTLFTPSQSS